MADDGSVSSGDQSRDDAWDDWHGRTPAQDTVAACSFYRIVTQPSATIRDDEAPTALFGVDQGTDFELDIAVSTLVNGGPWHGLPTYDDASTLLSLRRK